MSTINTTTSTGWTIDYEWDTRKGQTKVYRVWVYSKEIHPIEGKRFDSYNKARRVALEMGLQPERCTN